MAVSDQEYEQLRDMKDWHVHEFLDFVAGEKPAVHGGVFGEERCAEIQDWFEEHGYAFGSIESPTPDTRSNPTPNNDSRYLYFIADSTETVTALNNAFGSSESEFGRLLGFPDCCIEHYSSDRRSPKDVIPGKITTIETYPVYTNEFLRLDGTSLLSHFPCQYDCEESIAIGKRRLELLEAHDPERAAAYRDELACFILYHRELGSLYASEYTRDGNTVHHDGFETPVNWTDNAFFDIVNDSSEVVLNSECNVTVDGETFDGDDVAVAFFE